MWWGSERVGVGEEGGNLGGGKMNRNVEGSIMVSVAQSTLSRNDALLTVLSFIGENSYRRSWQRDL